MSLAQVLSPPLAIRSSRTGSIRQVGPIRQLMWLALALCFLSRTVLASDHADPIDPFSKERLEGGITDLFAFPVTDAGQVAVPFARRDDLSLVNPDLRARDPLTDEQQSGINALVVILCVRRQLTQTPSLELEPYTYRINMDLHSTVVFTEGEGSGPAPAEGSQPGGGYRPSMNRSPRRPAIDEARVRYGGVIPRPEGISPDVTIQLRLKNDATLNGNPQITGLKLRDRIEVWTGVRDDPFIFPAFFGTNVVAMVLRIPMDCFPEGQRDWLLWATSHRNGEQIDHVGRSLRTQNPRFELLNTLPPHDHKAAIDEEHEDPSLLRDLALRFNLQSLYAYRAWDFVPDVMIYTRRYPAGFPNGRLLTDDVAAILAQHGDTMLLELSHQAGGWPRRTTNDKTFLADFPYLAEPWPDREPPARPRLSRKNQLILWAIGLAILAVLILAALQLVHLVRVVLGLKLRRHYS